MSRYERTGWRDEALSFRHRLWGYDAPGVDVDWLLIEYDNAAPVALIDYKQTNSPRVGQPVDANSRAIGNLAERATVPAFVVRYQQSGDGWEFFVIANPLSTYASGLMPSNRRLDEVGYVRWLYELRGRNVPASVLDAIRAMKAVA